MKTKTRIIGRILRSVLTITFALLLIEESQAKTSINSCPFVITTPGAYVVNADLACSGTAITILADDVDLDLNGHTISGDGTGTGIYAPGRSKVHLSGGAVQNFEIGIYLTDPFKTKVSNMTARYRTAE